MFCKLKRIVVFLRLISHFIVLRNFGRIISDYSSKYAGILELSQFRKVEKLSKKLKKAELDLCFLNSCQRFNVFPRFVCFPLPNVNKYDVFAIRKRLLKSSINKRSKEKRKLQYEKDKLENQIKKVLSGIEYYILYRALHRNIDQEAHSILRNHQKKLKALTKNCVLPFDSSETINNISSHILTEDEKDALKFGLTHSIFPPYINKTDIYASFESIYQSMKSHLNDKSNDSKLKSELSHAAQLYVNSFQPSNKDIKTHKILKNLHKNKDIIILKPDKGNGVVILNKIDYVKGIYDIINDKNKFKELNNDPTINREGKLQRFLRDLKKKGKIDKDAYNSIYPSGSQPALIYGLPKMHKVKSSNEMPPFRPIVSSINTYNYRLAKYLCNLLQPYLPTTYSISDSFSFIQELNTIDLSNKFMVSFDVASLFTNIPLKESIDLAISYITEGNSTLKLSKVELSKLFSISTAETHFRFDGKVFDQIDGVAMGSPLAPVLANLFLGHYENLWLKNYQGPSVLFYRRYVDDTFCVFNSENEAKLFFDFLNSQHPNIKFTMEKETNKILAFLDVCIDNNDPSCLKTSTYHKKTFTGLLTNFFSYTSFSYKVGLIRTLVDRAYKINNSLLSFNNDIKKLTHIFKRNQFPDYLINKVVKAYLDNNGNHAPSDNNDTLYFKLPFLPFSNLAQRKVRTLIKKYCSNLRIKLAFSSFKIKNIMKVKDSVPRSLRSCVVYKFNCAGCNSVYVGETCRHISTRIREHLFTDKNSHIFKHLKSSKTCRNSCNDSCFKIIDRAKSYHQLKVKEALHILWEGPDLNKQVQHYNFSLTF